MQGFDFWPEEGSKVHAVYKPDGDVVSVQFMVGDKTAGSPFTFSRAEAVRFGETVMQTGIWDDFLTEVSPDTVRAFAKRLRDYGQDGK